MLTNVRTVDTVNLSIYVIALGRYGCISLSVLFLGKF